MIPRARYLALEQAIDAASSLVRMAGTAARRQAEYPQTLVLLTFPRSVPCVKEASSHCSL